MRQDSSRGKFKFFDKELNVPDAEFHKMTVADLKAQLGGRYSATLRSGGEHLLNGRRTPVNDSDTLESVGVKGDERSIRQYDLIFQVDASLHVEYESRPPERRASFTRGSGSAAATPSAVSRAPSKPAVPGSSDSGVSERHTSHTRQLSGGGGGESGIESQLKATIRIFLDGGYHNITVAAQAKDFKKDLEFRIPDADYGAVTVTELKKRMATRFPYVLLPGGKFIKDDDSVEPVGDSRRLYDIGIKGSYSGTKSYLCLFEIDRAATPPLVQTSSSARMLPTPAPSLTPAPVEPGPKPAASETQLGLSIRIFMDGQQACISVKAVMKDFSQDHEFNVDASAFRRMTVEHFRSKLPSKWPSTTPGGKIYGGSKGTKSFVDSDLLTEIGVELDSSRTTSCQFLLDIGASASYSSPRSSSSHTSASSSNAAPSSGSSGSTSSSNVSSYSSSAPATSARSESPGQLTVDIRLFQDSGFVFAAWAAVGKGVTKEKEFSTSTGAWDTMTARDLKAKFREAGLPDTENGGLFVSSSGKSHFLDRYKLNDIGLVLDPSATKTYQLILDLASPAAAATPAAAPTSAAASASSPSKPASGAAKAPASGPEFRIEATVRIFLDSGSHNVSLQGRGKLDNNKNFSQTSELTIPDREFPALSIADLKKKLGNKWPAFYDGGWVLNEEGKKTTFGDHQCMAELGVTGNPSRTVTYQMSFVIDTNVPFPRPVERTTSSSSSSAQPAPAPVVAPAPAEEARPPWRQHSRTTTPTSHITHAHQVEPPSDDISTSIRIFLEPGYKNLSVNARGHQVSYENDFSISEAQFNSMNFGQLKARFGSRFPPTKDGGFYVHGTREAFTDSTMVTSLGITGDPKATRVYDIIFLKK